jgi:hypothetical protein
MVLPFTSGRENFAIVRPMLPRADPTSEARALDGSDKANTPNASKLAVVRQFIPGLLGVFLVRQTASVRSSVPELATAVPPHPLSDTHGGAWNFTVRSSHSVETLSWFRTVQCAESAHLRAAASFCYLEDAYKYSVPDWPNIRRENCFLVSRSGKDAVNL